MNFRSTYAMSKVVRFDWSDYVGEIIMDELFYDCQSCICPSCVHNAKVELDGCCNDCELCEDSDYFENNAEDCSMYEERREEY